MADEVARSQNSAHGAGHDYVAGSPHLRHARLNAFVVGRLLDTLRAVTPDGARPKVLEVGAGHGPFTQHLLDAGAEVTVTEMSLASAQHLSEVYRNDERVRVVHDPDGSLASVAGEQFDLAVAISLVHHIPDYVDFVHRVSDLIRVGGGFYSAQDPTYYPRRSRPVQWASRGTYLLWRLGQGNYQRGLRTRMRRLKGEYSDTEESDLVEYHVVRQGVDEEALVAALSQRFAEVELRTYWSTQSPLFQRLLQRWELPTDFALLARNRHPDGG